MSDEKKTLAEWEQERGFIVDGMDPKKKLSEAEINDIPLREKTGVNHPDRIKFLKDNGYKVTRANMIDSSLSARSKDTPEPRLSDV